MTQYFIRFAWCEAYLQNDLKRGYSFHAYKFYDSLMDWADEWSEIEDMESEEEIETFLLEDCGIAQNSDGRWGVARPGLCGYGPFETIEEAEEEAREKQSYLGMDVCGIFTGYGVYDDRLDEMESVFRPTSLVKTMEVVPV